jgi:hypothetical protein
MTRRAGPVSCLIDHAAVPAAWSALDAYHPFLALSVELSFAGPLESETIAVGRPAASRAGREGIAAFLAKRPPVFPGVPGSG